MTKVAPQRTVADVVGEALGGRAAARDAFGVLGSGNLVVTNALCRTGVRFHPARHESGAVAMADGYARTTGLTGICSVHQGPGLTNTMTALAEAAKSRTPVLVLAGDTPAAALTSNFRINQHALVESVGAIAERVHSAESAARDALRALDRADSERRPVVLMLPIDLQAQPATEDTTERTDDAPPAAPEADQPLPQPQPTQIAAAADAIALAARPVIIAGRGAVLADAGDALETLGARIGALLATSAPAHGLFAGLPYALGISGGFATPYAAEVIAGADVVLAFGASLNRWTTKHGELIDPQATLIQTDLDPTAIGRDQPAQIALVGDARATARALAGELKVREHHNVGLRTPATEAEIAGKGWADEPYEDESTDAYLDPRTLSKTLNELLPPDRAVAVDSGAFTGYPSMYLDMADPRAWLFVNGFQAVGLGLGNAIGAAVAHPERVTVAALGDGGAFMALPELETAARLKLNNLLVVVYDDSAYGAEVHHFGPMGHDTSQARFPDVDLAAIATAAGARGATVRTTRELKTAVSPWLEEANRTQPLVLDAKVNPTVCAEWLAEAFRAG